MKILLVILVVALLAGGPAFVGPTYGTNYGYGVSGVGLLLAIVLVVLLMRAV